MYYAVLLELVVLQPKVLLHSTMHSHRSRLAVTATNGEESWSLGPSEWVSPNLRDQGKEEGGAASKWTDLGPPAAGGLKDLVLVVVGLCLVGRGRDHPTNGTITFGLDRSTGSRAQQSLGDLNGLGRRTWSLVLMLVLVLLVLVLVLIAILGRWGHSKQQRKQSGTSNMSCCV